MVSFLFFPNHCDLWSEVTILNIQDHGYACLEFTKFHEVISYSVSCIYEANSTLNLNALEIKFLTRATIFPSWSDK